MKRASFLLVALLLVAGCAATPTENVPAPTRLGGRADGGPSGLGPQQVPPGCDANRTAEAHYADAILAPSLFDRPIIPCMSKTGSISREPTIGISSKGTVFHYPAMTGDNTKPMGVAISKDHGATWRRVLPSIQGVPTHPTSVDPYFYLDPATDRAFADDLMTPNCSYFSWSDDDGATWQHSYSGCLETDHQTIFAGKPVTSQTRGYPNVVYRCAINAVALGAYSTMSTCQKSIDGGMTWLAPGQPAFTSPPDRAPPNHCTGAHGHGFADHKGTIYLPKGHCGVPMLGISADEGATWRRVQIASNGIQGHDGGVGVDPAGNIYYTWTATNRLPYLAYSRDGGTTWSAPIMIGAPEILHARFVELNVGGVGKIAWVYMGTKGPNDKGVQTYDAYLGVSYNALDPNPTFYSATVHDPVADAFRVGTCCGGIQDFIDVRIGPDGTAWGAFVDDCLGEGTNCREDPSEQLDTHREGAAGWFWGGPSLWDEADPNGPYK
ncbi:MAG TPA: sialidase family protein [Candidatus Thermoplasmatota archaeon]|nr:sialidase family protein [Candidatus Thermoplasmatota archaeon]